MNNLKNNLLRSRNNSRNNSTMNLWFFVFVFWGFFGEWKAVIFANEKQVFEVHSTCRIRVRNAPDTLRIAHVYRY